MMMDAELKCLRAVGSLEERMRNACHAPNATFESVVKVRVLRPYDVVLVPAIYSSHHRRFQLSV